MHDFPLRFGVESSKLEWENKLLKASALTKNKKQISTKENTNRFETALHTLNYSRRLRIRKIQRAMR